MCSRPLLQASLDHERHIAQRNVRLNQVDLLSDDTQLTSFSELAGSGRLPQDVTVPARDYAHLAHPPFVDDHGASNSDLPRRLALPNLEIRNRATSPRRRDLRVRRSSAQPHDPILESPAIVECGA